IADYAAGRFDAAADALSDVRDRAQAFGGSHAQRDLLTLLLISAARQAGQPQRARHWLNERRMRVPASGLARRLFEQLERA
ncbi:MAG: tetratricopeptide repeat protein, partial [Gammaproteobacteria bacterium]